MTLPIDCGQWCIDGERRRSLTFTHPFDLVLTCEIFFSKSQPPVIGGSTPFGEVLLRLFFILLFLRFFIIILFFIRLADVIQDAAMAAATQKQRIPYGHLPVRPIVFSKRAKMVACIGDW